MVIKVGINGFGRIGRIMLRTCFRNPDIEVSAINDPAIDVEYICYLIKFDSTHGKFDGDVLSFQDDIKINGKLIKIFHNKQPSAVPWQSAGVQYVIESSGMFTSLEKAEGHLSEEGVRRVVVTAPSVDVPMIILGVNSDKLHLEQRIISCASSTLYCLAPIMKVLEHNYGVSEGFVTSVHAMTPSLKPLDGLCLRGKHWRDHRSIHQNIIPATTGACKALGKILPQLKDKMVGMAFRVPIVNVSVLDLTIRLNTDTTLQNIVRSVDIASKTHLKGIINISKEKTVSSDFIGDSHSCILDVNSSMQLRPNFYKLICWYENEFSYACRVIDSIFLSERQFCTETTKNLTQHSREGLRQFTNVGGDCKNTLPNNLRSFSKNIDLKVNIDYRPALGKRPLSAQLPVMNQSTIANSKTKSKSDIFKIIDYDSIIDKSTVKHNKNSLFPSCISLKSSNAEGYSAKIQNRLENVRKEFNKMMNITEDLLKKSYKLNFHGQKKSVSSNGKIVCTELKKESDCMETNLNNKELQLNHNYTGCLMNINKNNDINHENQKSSLEENQKNTKLQNLGTLSFEIDNKIMKYNKVNDEIGYHEENKFHVKTFYESGSTDSQLISSKSIVPIVEQKGNISNANIQDPSKQSLDAINLECFSAMKRNFQNQIHNLISDDNILKVRNIIICQDDINITKALKNNFVENITECITLGKTENQKEQNEGNILRQRIIKSSRQNMLLQKNLNLTLHTSQENTNKSISNDANNIIEDIYDKLDSTSATNSENSFYCNEKKSQVIYINDLTNSLEDLARLEKICKIIEISDDLSDELFSTLQVRDISKFKNKEWSFKDLCEKIKLDDFLQQNFW